MEIGTNRRSLELVSSVPKYHARENTGKPVIITEECANVNCCKRGFLD